MFENSHAAHRRVQQTGGQLECERFAGAGFTKKHQRFARQHAKGDSAQYVAIVEADTNALKANDGIGIGRFPAPVNARRIHRGTPVIAVGQDGRATCRSGACSAHSIGGAGGGAKCGLAAGVKYSFRGRFGATAMLGPNASSARSAPTPPSKTAPPASFRGGLMHKK